jgi:hypothetical protein
MTLSITKLYHYAECYCAECYDLFICMLNVVLLSVVRLNVVMMSVVRLNVVMLSVVVPLKWRHDIKRNDTQQNNALYNNIFNETQLNNT